ncbi:phospholipase B1, membrane-associated-like [Drosophila nasuta]|uniref:phospholipase B1, membrane-associated-like n=1 Tax=Drosophila nasuta TaxID=42062 RepID=UPI00295EFEC7|nr:phospholipase B1, membrane-associated-like [Drosophila nasuta]
MLLLLILTLLSLTRSRPESGVEIVNLSTQLLDQSGFKQLPFRLKPYNIGVYYTKLDDRLRQTLLDVRNRTQVTVLSKIDSLLEHNAKIGRLQQPVAEDYSFPCNLSKGRSPEPPSHITRLRPGDIDIVAALGDSTHAGTGILALGWRDLMTEYRGFSYGGGGIESWRTVLTVPNILKLYNPNLYGYAVAHCLAVDPNSRFNVAEPALYLLDLPFQAHVLIDRLRKDPKVDMAKHWKMINIHVGPNDVCTELCHRDDLEAFLRTVKSVMYETFRVLRDNVPRLLINFVIQPEIHDMLNTIHKMPQDCKGKTIFFCHCHPKYDKSHFYNAAERFVRMQKEIASMPEFQRDDFAIVNHGILRNISDFWSKNGVLDHTFMANDCIHFSQKGQAVLTKLLWNSMFAPTDFRFTEAWSHPFEHFLCPNAENLFLRTKGDQY